jgi:hypothetical protein
MKKIIKKALGMGCAYGYHAWLSYGCRADKCSCECHKRLLPGNGGMAGLGRRGAMLWR